VGVGNFQEEEIGLGLMWGSCFECFECLECFLPLRLGAVGGGGGGLPGPLPLFLLCLALGIVIVFVLWECNVLW
jgi:hypothetical protein